MNTTPLANLFAPLKPAGPPHRPQYVSPEMAAKTPCDGLPHGWFACSRESALKIFERFGLGVFFGTWRLGAQELHYARFSYRGEDSHRVKADFAAKLCLKPATMEWFVN